ncbi:MAG: hypothetical protein DRI95_14745 [Bacteroidetes bacterium]|nr:MAG: hypothetical protein DRI95_14745 [Bacteroidota bacterium]RLD74531.1 MAG: hypothetical protein DRJ07_19560 [Bacteroidota bacterium]
MEKNKLSVKQKIKIFILKHFNIFLLLSILGMFFISPALEGITGNGYSQTLFFTIIFLSAVVAVKTNNNNLLIIALIISAYIWFDLLFFTHDERFSFTFFIILIYFIYILIKLIIQLIKTENVDSDVIMESINIYLIIGLVGAIVLNVVNHFIPGSINTIPAESGKFHDYLYFSFVTLTTLGYGDISPVLPMAKAVAVFLAIIGQFYIAIVMAFLISKFISQKSSSQKD